MHAVADLRVGLCRRGWSFRRLCRETRPFQAVRGAVFAAVRRNVPSRV